MDYTIVIILAAVAFFAAMLIPKKKNYEYTELDKMGIISNIILFFLYVLLSVVIFLILSFWNTLQDSEPSFRKLLIDFVYYSGLYFPHLSIAAIITSAIARKRGKSRFGFWIQFLPLAVFLVMLIFKFLLDKV